jgi:hypothetical protein
MFCILSLEQFLLSAYRELFESQAFGMSMSMSMSMSFDYSYETITSSPSMIPSDGPSLLPTATPSSTPTTPTPSTPPTEIVNNSFQVADSCEAPTLVTIPLEVDTTIGVTFFEFELNMALETALSNEYILCDYLFLDENTTDTSSFNKDFRYISIVEEKNGTFQYHIIVRDKFRLCTNFIFLFLEICLPKSESADICRVVRAEIVIAGQVDWTLRELEDSLEYIFENDFPLAGIIDVRLKQNHNGAAANSLPGENVLESSESERSAVVAILSTAAGTIIAAVVIRSIKQGRDDDKPETNEEEGSQVGAVPITLSSSTVV